MLSCPHCLVSFHAKGAFIVHMSEMHSWPERRAKEYWEINTERDDFDRGLFWREDELEYRGD